MAKSQALQQKQEQKPEKPDPAKIMEKVMMKGDLSDLTPDQRVTYYNHVCHSLKLNPFTKPFDFLEVTDENGKPKVVLYANKDCATQLKANHDVSIFKLEEKTEANLLIVTAYARTPDGREDVDRGVVSIQGLMAKNLANAHMKAVTKAKRRVTLSICGLGFLDESEVDSIPGARRMPSPEDDAVMTDAEREALTIRHKTSGLDQWRCTQESGSRQLAMDLIKVCDELKAKGVDDELMRQRLPGGVASRKDLTAAQAEEAIKAYRHWLKTYGEVVEGEVVVNG
jgi:hypothetical protein